MDIGAPVDSLVLSHRPAYGSAPGAAAGWIMGREPVCTASIPTAADARSATEASVWSAPPDFAAQMAFGGSRNHRASPLFMGPSAGPSAPHSRPCFDSSVPAQQGRLCLLRPARSARRRTTHFKTGDFPQHVTQEPPSDQRPIVVIPVSLVRHLAALYQFRYAARGWNRTVRSSRCTGWEVPAAI
jgi:hypothetical protein